MTGAARADRGVRLLDVPDETALRAELARTGCEVREIDALLPQARCLLLRLDAVEARAARLLQREMRAAGGDAAVHAGTVERTAVVLMGSRAQLTTACTALRACGGSLAGTAQAMEGVLDALAHPPAALQCGPYALPLGRKTYLMGILNLTPDSFSGDGLAGDVDAAVRRAEAMLADGADILDIGGESSRPGAAPVPLDEELRRVVPVVRALAARFQVPISVDTYKSDVARAAVEAGATMINDISGLRFDPAMACAVAAAKVPVVVMHIQGTPRTMQQAPHYDDLMTEICAYLRESTAIAIAAGIPRAQVILDPGFGFGKTIAHNLELLRRLRELTSFGQAILLGTSRKATIGILLGGLPPEERAEGTAATVALGIAHGADLVRVHDVRAMARTARVADAIVRGMPDMV